MDQNFTNELANIRERNARVEADKAWEVSWTRRIFIAILTYIIALAWLLIIRETSAALKALVPAIGYILSTLSLPAMKKYWLNHHKTINN